MARPRKAYAETARARRDEESYSQRVLAQGGAIARAWFVDDRGKGGVIPVHLRPGENLYAACLRILHTTDSRARHAFMDDGDYTLIATRDFTAAALARARLRVPL